MFRSLALALLAPAAAHQFMSFPQTRVGYNCCTEFNCPIETNPPNRDLTVAGQCTFTNGIAMEGTTLAGHKSHPDALMQKNGKYHVQLDQNWFWYPCGGMATEENKLAWVLMATDQGAFNYMDLANRENNMWKNPKFFDFGQAHGFTPLDGFEANQVVQVTLYGSHHLGMVRLALCYENCDRADSFEKYILGYWYMEQVGISRETIKLTVQLPNRKCDRCVLQYLSDASDGRSYVGCADIKIAATNNPTAAASTSTEHYCNGHPLCNCKNDGGSDIGLGKSCPTGTAAQGSVMSFPLASSNPTEFCKLCAKDACPTTCGGRVTDVLGGGRNPNRKPTHINELDSLSRKVLCGGATSCSCPGCLGDLSSRIQDTRPADRSVGAQAAPPPTGTLVPAPPLTTAVGATVGAVLPPVLIRQAPPPQCEKWMADWCLTQGMACGSVGSALGCTLAPARVQPNAPTTPPGPVPCDVAISNFCTQQRLGCANNQCMWSPQPPPPPVCPLNIQQLCGYYGQQCGPVAPGRFSCVIGLSGGWSPLFQRLEASPANCNSCHTYTTHAHCEAAGACAESGTGVKVEGCEFKAEDKTAPIYGIVSDLQKGNVDLCKALCCETVGCLGVYMETRPLNEFNTEETQDYCYIAQTFATNSTAVNAKPLSWIGGKTLLTVGVTNPHAGHGGGHTMPVGAAASSSVSLAWVASVALATMLLTV